MKDFLLALLKNPTVLALLAIGILAFSLWNTYKANVSLKDELTRTRLVAKQNEQALKDSLQTKEDSMTVLTVSVRDLQAENKKVKTERDIFKAKYKLAVDSLHFQGGGSGTIIGDSLAIVKFTEKKGIALVSGETGFNLFSKRTTWNLDIAFDAIEAGSNFYFDEVDSLFKIQSFSLTPGVNIIGYATLDKNAYPALYQKVVPPPRDPNFFKVGGIVDKNSVSLGIGLQPSRWQFLFNYRLYDKYDLPNQAWYDRIQIGVYYALF